MEKMWQIMGLLLLSNVCFQYFSIPVLLKSVQTLYFWRKFHSLVLLCFYYLLLLPAVKQDFQIPLYLQNFQTWFYKTGT